MIRDSAPFGGGAKSISRRDFLGKSGAAVASVTLASPLAIGQTPGEPFRIALIGTGARMNTLLGTILQQDDVEIVACADPSARNLNRTLERIERTTGKRPEGYPGEDDFIEVLGRDDVQGVFSATPCHLHARICALALEKSKHLYGEKPLCLTVGETRLLKEAERNATSILQIGFQRRTSQRYIEGIQRIHDGEIGEPIEGRAACSKSGGPLMGTDRWLNARAKSGDWMLEQACHTWDVLYWVAGALPTQAWGAGRRDVFKAQAPDRDVTDSFVATLEYRNGLRVSYNHTWIAPRNDRGAFTGVYERIAGLDGGIDLGRGRLYYADRAKREVSIHLNEPNHTESSVKHFFECVREGRRPNSTVDNGIAATLTGLLVRKAVDEHRTVTMDEILG